MIPKIIKTGFAAIHLIYFFTAGPDEVYFFWSYYAYLTLLLVDFNIIHLLLPMLLYDSSIAL